MLEGKTIAVLGAGRLGETLIRGLLEAGAVTPDRFTITAGHEETVNDISRRLGVRPAHSNADAVSTADLVILTVKPQTLESVLVEIGPVLRKEQILISCVASARTPFIETHLHAAVPVIRAMPNTPSMLKRGMTGLCPGRHADDGDVAKARRVFDAVGRTVVLDEKHMDAVTGLSASGPAFIYIVIESLAEAGVKVGLPRDVATELAAQTVAGAGHMVLESGKHPAHLKDLVTTPAGCTIDGILELEDGGLRVTLIKAVVRATERAKELHEG